MMEDVDNITLQTLRAVGVTIDEEVHSVAQLSADALVSATACCLERIHPDLASAEEDRLPHRLPVALSARFAVAHRLAQTVKADGYKGDLGYQTFLYPNERDSRTLLMFLVERLPKDAVTASDELLSSSALLHRAIAAAIADDLAAPWLPWFCRRRPAAPPAAARRLVVASAPADDRLAARVPPVHRQATGGALHRSLLERSADLLAAEQLGGERTLRAAAAASAEVVKAAAAASVEARRRAEERPVAAAAEKRQEKEAASAAAEGKLQDEEESETREERRQRQEAESSAARASADEAERRVARLDAKRGRLAEKLAAAASSVDEAAARCRQLEEEAAAKRRGAEMLPRAAENAARLEKEVNEQRRAVEATEAEWANKAAPVMSELAGLRAENAGRRALSQRKESELAEARASLSECSEETRRREETLAVLRQKVGQLEAAPSRASYTRRLLDIVGNIKKQKLEVDRVLAETRGLQKEINAASGKLERTFTETDELVFRDARKDDAVRTAYKLLASLHANYELLVATEEERGALLREIRELEEQVDAQKRRTREDQLETAARDAEEMKRLNEELRGKLKGRRAESKA